MNPNIHGGFFLSLPVKGRPPSPRILKSPLLDRFSAISHAFTTRLGGISPPPFDSLNLSSGGGDKKENVRKNIEALRSAMSLKSGLFLLEQVHGDHVLVVEDAVAAGSNRPVDAAVTAIPGIPLTILTADCLPVLLYDPKRNTAGAVHAGWRGTASGITEKTVKVMIERFGCDAADITAAMGPAVGPCCYEVDDAVSDGFRKGAVDDWRYAAERCRGGDRRWMLDLAKANSIQLLRAGVRKGRISLPPYCTCCKSDLFFSYRRDGKMSGRQGAILMLNQREGLR